MSATLNAPASTLAPSLRNQRVSVTEFYEGVSKRFQEVKFLGIFPGKGDAPPTLCGPSGAPGGEQGQEGGAGASVAAPPKGALAGVPLVVSNDIDVKDSATHCGVEGLKCAVAEADAPVLASLRARGAHLLGQVTGSELSLSLASPHIAKNPFTAFGLAGGSAAAAVAARVATLGMAVDTLGSVRASAALCGVTAFRPTHGRYTRGGTLGLSSTLSTPVALARTVRDLQLVDAVLSTAAAEAVVGAGSAAEVAGAGGQQQQQQEQPAAEDAAAAPPMDAKEVASVKMQSAARGFISRRRVQKVRSGAPGALERAGEGFATPSKGEAMRAARYAAQLETSTARLEALEAGVVVEGGGGVAPVPTAAAAAADSGSSESSSSSGPLSPGSSTPVLPTGMAFSADLLGLRIGVPRRTSSFFSNLPPGLAAVVEAALSRLSKAGAELVEVNVDEGLSHSEGGSVCALACSTAHTILGYEAPREIASYAYCRSVPQPKPVKVVVEGEEGEEAAAEEGGDEEGGAAAAATPLPPTLVPLDTLVAPSVLLRAYKGPTAYTTLLTGQLSHKSPAFVTATAYRSAVVHSRLAVRRCFTTLFKRNRLAALLYPATKLAPAPLKGAEGLSVDLPNGTVVDATEAYLANLYPASVAGMPCVVVPCGLTKPRSGAPPGSMDAERLPVALEFIGLPNADEALLALAAAFQRLAPLLADPIVVAAFKTGVARDVE